MWLSAHSDKRAVERLVLLYSPLWMAVIGAAQRWHFFRGWSDAGHLAFGAALALPLWLAPLAFASSPAAARALVRFNVLIALFSFLQCYFGSALFFDAFGMQYHFHVHWILNRTPIFLYLLTVAYFSTYFVALVVAWRAFRTRFPSLPRAAVWLARAVLSYLVAFAETAAMATPAMREWFSYQNPRAVMLYGSLCYGTVFFISLPLFYELDEAPEDRRKPIGRLIWDLLAVNMIILIAYELYGALWIHT